MAKIEKIKRSGKSIQVRCTLEESRIEEKFYVCIVNKSAEEISKPLLRKGKNFEVFFSFQDAKEMQTFVKVYLLDSKKEKIGDVYSIEEKKDIFPVFTKAVVAVCLFLLCSILFIISSCRQRGGIKSFIIEEACFKDFSTLFVQGKILFKERTKEEEKAEILSDLQLQLFTGDIPGIEKTIQENPFSIEIPFSFAPEKKYYIQGKISGIAIENALKEINFHPQFSVVRIQNTMFMKDRKLEIIVQNVFSGNNLLQLELFPENFSPSQSPILITKVLPETRENRFFLGPVQTYGNRFVVVLKSYGFVPRVLDQQKVFYPYPVGKLARVHFFNRNTILAQGEWEASFSVILELLEKESLRLIEKRMPEKFFQEKFSIPSLSKEYLVRLVCQEEILDNSAVKKDEIFLEYNSLIEKMPMLVKTLDSYLVHTWQASSSFDIQELYNFRDLCHQREMSCNKLLKESLDASSLHSLQKFYRNLQNISNIGLETRSLLQRQLTKRDLDSIEKKEEEIFFLLDSAWKILKEFYPDIIDANFFPGINQILKEKKDRERIRTLLQYVNACTQSGQYNLSVDVCNQGILEYPDVWQFMLGRYILHHLLEKQNESNTSGFVYQQKLQEDYNKLMKILPLEFHKRMLDLDYKRAYFAGNALLKINPDMQDIKEKLEKIKIEKIKTEEEDIFHIFLNSVVIPKIQDLKK